MTDNAYQATPNGPRGLETYGGTIPLHYGQNPFEPQNREELPSYGYLDLRESSNAMEDSAWFDVILTSLPFEGITGSPISGSLPESLTLQLGVPELRALRAKIDAFLESHQE